MTSIAQELSLKPNVKVTLVISDICEEFIKSQNYNFDIEVVHSAVDKRKPNEQQLADVGEYISEYENDVLEIYIPKWKDPKNLPDIVVSEVFAFAGRDLAEIYKLKHVAVCTSLLMLLTVTDEDTYPEYLPMHTPTSTFESTDSIILRSLRYLPKKIVRWFVSYYIMSKPSDKIRSKYGLLPNDSRNINSFYIIESFFGLEDSLLLPPYIELVGYIENDQFNRPINPEVKSWIDNNKGFIYIATGSQFILTISQQEALLNVFSSMNYDFLVSSKVLKSELKNVKIVGWTNQLEVLQSENILAFITHGGYSSLVESVQNIVPFLCVPKEFDQFINCETSENQGIGKLLKNEEFKVERIINYLNELITNKSFKENMKKLKAIMKGFKGKKRAAEIILEQAQIGCEHLIPRSHYLPWYQVNELDIFIVYFIVICILYTCIKKYWKRNNKSNQD